MSRPSPGYEVQAAMPWATGTLAGVLRSEAGGLRAESSFSKGLLDLTLGHPKHLAHLSVVLTQGGACELAIRCLGKPKAWAPVGVLTDNAVLNSPEEATVVELDILAGVLGIFHN